MTTIDKDTTLVFLPDKEQFYAFLNKRLSTVDISMLDIQDILNISLDNTCKRFIPLIQMN
jgi:hypothetical protein